jgi:hypothetical protein
MAEKIQAAMSYTGEIFDPREIDAVEIVHRHGCEQGAVGLRPIGNVRGSSR